MELLKSLGQDTNVAAITGVSVCGSGWLHVHALCASFLLRTTFSLAQPWSFCLRNQSHALLPARLQVLAMHFIDGPVLSTDLSDGLVLPSFGGPSLTVSTKHAAAHGLASFRACFLPRQPVYLSPFPATNIKSHSL